MGYRDQLITTAKQYIGQEEIQPNLGFKDPTFAAKMNKVGFYKGASWCGFFDMVVVLDVYKDSKWLPLLKKHMSASTQTMYANFLKSPEFHVSKEFKSGCIVIWQHGDTDNGHTGIGDTDTDANFTSIEGNTNNNGSSNGFEVCENRHTYNFGPAGFHLKGFIWLPDTEDMSTVQEFKNQSA